MSSIKFVDQNGQPLTTINRSTPFRIQLDTGESDGPETIDVVFSWDDGDETDTFTISKMPDGTYSSTIVTAERGGTGGGSVGAMGFSWSTGDAGPMRVEQGEYLTVSWGDTASRVRVFNTYVQEGIYLNRLFLGQVAQYYTTLAMNTNAVIRAFEAIGEANLDDDGKRLLALARQAHEIATTGISIIGRAVRYLNNDERMLDTQRFYISSWYVNRLKGDFDPAVTQDPNYRHSLINYSQRGEYMGQGEFDAVQMASERGRRHAEEAMWRGLSQALLGAYRLLVNATGAAQVMTLFGTNEMGRQAKDWERLVALFDLVSQAALMGAVMRFKVTHTVGTTQPRLPRTAAAADPETAAIGARIDPTSAGITDAAAAQAQLVARRHGVHILTRQSGGGVAELRTKGFSPKPMEIKAKTINQLDVQLGAPASGLKQVGFFEPKMPATRPAGMDDATWGRLQQRYDQRMAEYRGPTGQKMQKLQEDGLIEVRDGVAHDTGLVSGSGRPITGDYDLFEIVFPDGTPVPTHVYNAVVADLTVGPFQAMHGAHMRWDIQMGDWKTFAEFVHAADVLDTNLGIYNKIVRSHHSEPLIVFGGDRPPYALTSDATPPLKLGDLPAGATSAGGGTSVGPFLNPTTSLRYSTLPFLDPDEAAQLQLADDDWNRFIAPAFPPWSELEGPIVAGGPVDGPLDGEGPPSTDDRADRATGPWGKIAAGVVALGLIGGGAWWLNRDDGSMQVAEPPAAVDEVDDDGSTDAVGAGDVSGEDSPPVEPSPADADRDTDEDATGADAVTDPGACGVLPDGSTPFAPGSYAPYDMPCGGMPVDGYAGCDPTLLPCSPTSSLPLFAGATTVGVTHSGSVADALTGRTGPSQATHAAAELTGVAGWWDDADLLISSDCGGTLLSGRAPFGSEVPHPLVQYGPCTVTTAMLELPDGRTRPLVTKLFGSLSEFNVDASETAPAFAPLDGLVVADDRFTVSGWAAAPNTVLGAFAATVIPDDCLAYSIPNWEPGWVEVLGGCDGTVWVYTAGRTTGPGFPAPWTPVAHGAGFVNPTGEVAGASAMFSGLPTSFPLFDQTVFPCGAGHVGLTICPAGEPPVDAGSLVVVNVAFPEALPLEATADAAAVTVHVGPVGDASYTVDFETWTITGNAAGTRARAIVRDNSLTLAIPHDELPDGELLYAVRTEIDGDVLDQATTTVVGSIRTPEVEIEPPSDTTAEPEPEPEPETPVETVDEFYAGFAEAVRTGDTDHLLDRLHPLVLEAYPDRCPDVLATFVDPDFDVEVISLGDVGPWTWTLPDGRSFDVDDATTVTIALTGRGQSGEPVESHLVAGERGYLWFTYCT